MSIIPIATAMFVISHDEIVCLCCNSDNAKGSCICWLGVKILCLEEVCVQMELKKIDQNTPLGAQILRKLAKIMQVM